MRASPSRNPREWDLRTSRLPQLLQRVSALVGPGGNEDRVGALAGAVLPCMVQEYWDLVCVRQAVLQQVGVENFPRQACHAYGEFGNTPMTGVPDALGTALAGNAGV